MWGMTRARLTREQVHSVFLSWLIPGMVKVREKHWGLEGLAITEESESWSG